MLIGIYSVLRSAKDLMKNDVVFVGQYQLLFLDRSSRARMLMQQGIFIASPVIRCPTESVEKYGFVTSLPIDIEQNMKKIQVKIVFFL